MPIQVFLSSSFKLTFGFSDNFSTKSRGFSSHVGYWHGKQDYFDHSDANQVVINVFHKYSTPFYLRVFIYKNYNY